MSTKKIEYKEYKEATYRFHIYDYKTGALIPAWCACKVCAETPHSYRIQICAAIPKHAIGDYLWVQKKFVTFKS